MMRRTLGRAAEVAVMQAADHWLSDDAAALGRLDFSRPGRVVAQRLMRARGVVVFEVLGEDSFQVPFVEGDHVIEAFASDRADQRTENVLWMLSDHQGSIRDIVSDDGTLRKHVDYSAFGQISGELHYDRGGAFVAPPNAEAIEQLFYYTGQEWDANARLYHYNARWYDPRAGRFLSEDPIGFDGGDPNLYRYALNNPVLYVDPTGLFTQLPTSYLPALGGSSGSASKPFSNVGYSTPSYATPSYNPPTVDQSLRQLNSSIKPYDYYNNLSTSATNPLRTPTVSEIQAQVHNNYFGDLYAQSPQGQAAARAQRDEAFSQYLKTSASPAEALVGTVLSRVERGERTVQRALGDPMVSGGFVPGVGEAIDVGIFAHPNSRPIDRVFAGGSLAVSVLTGGLAPNFGGAGRFFFRAGDDLLMDLGDGTRRVSSQVGEVIPDARVQQHHLMTNKNSVSVAGGGPYTPKFEKLAARRGITLEGAVNKVRLSRHIGPHASYNAEVYRRLEKATDGLGGEKFNMAFDKTLEQVRKQTITPGTTLNKLATGQGGGR